MPVVCSDLANVGTRYWCLSTSCRNIPPVGGWISVLLTSLLLFLFVLSVAVATVVANGYGTISYLFAFMSSCDFPNNNC
jgi:hypothetical protein